MNCVNASCKSARRTNQIRVPLWHLGFPIVRDAAYLADGAVGETQTLTVDDPPLCLHSHRITFNHPLTKERIAFEAEPPTWATAARLCSAERR